MVRSEGHCGAAFALIELLFTLGVVAVLLALLAPALAGTREAFRRAKCASQIASHMQVLSAYAIDSNDAWPFAFEYARREPPPSRFGVVTDRRADPYTAIGGLWHLPVLDAYNENPFHESLICPSDRELLRSRDDAAAKFGVDPSTIRGTLEYRISMAMYLDVQALDPAHPSMDPRFFVGQRHSAVLFPSSKAALFDVNPMHDTTLADPGTWPADHPVVRNVAGADGAVEYRSTIHLLPAVAMPGSFTPGHEVLARESRKLDFTVHGVRGRDW